MSFDIGRWRRHEPVYLGGIELALCWAAVIRLLTMVAPQPIGSVAFWTLTCGLFAAAAVVYWRRTRLPAMTTAMFLGAVFAAGMATVIAAFGKEAAGARLVRDPGFAIALVIVALVYSEKWWHPDVWQRLVERGREIRGWQVFLMRHIPDLRKEGDVR